MPIDQLANYAEVFGGAAVIVSLIYLAFQVRANTREQRHQRRFESFEIQNTIYDFMSGPANLSETFVKAARDYNNLTEAERIRFTNMYLKVFHAFDMIIGMHEDGSITADELARFDRYMIGGFNYPDIRYWWSNFADKALASDRVRERVDQVVAELEAQGVNPPTSRSVHVD